MTYGLNLSENYQRAATFVDKLLEAPTPTTLFRK